MLSYPRAWLLVVSATVMGLGGGALGQEALVRDDRNLSIRHEVETALGSGFSFLRTHLPAVDGSLPQRGAAFRKSQTLRRLFENDPLRRFAKDLPPPARLDVVATKDELSQLDPLASRSAAVHFAEGLSDLWCADALPGKEDPLIHKADVLLRRQCMDPASPRYGGFEIASEILSLQDMAPLISLEGTLPDRNVAVDGRNPDGVQPRALGTFVDRCQLSTGPEEGGFAPWPRDVPNRGDRPQPTIEATCVGLGLLRIYGIRPWEPERQRALVWLGSRWEALAHAPHDVVGRLAVALIQAGAYSIPLPSGRKVDWARTFAERLVNEQNADGSWKAQPTWTEQDPATVTTDAMMLLEYIYQAL